jgi:hypothetical protein
VLTLASAPSGFAAVPVIDLVGSGSDDGQVSHLTVSEPPAGFQIALLDGQAPQRPAAVLPLDGAIELRIEVLQRFVRYLRARRVDPLPRALQLTPYQRTRLIDLLHAFDFHAHGAGPREVAAALIDARAAALPAIEWKSSAARRKANRLIRDSIALVNRGYLKLLRGG